MSTAVLYSTELQSAVKNETIATIPVEEAAKEVAKAVYDAFAKKYSHWSLDTLQQIYTIVEKSLLKRNSPPYYTAKEIETAKAVLNRELLVLLPGEIRGKSSDISLPELFVVPCYTYKFEDIGKPFSERELYYPSELEVKRIILGLAWRTENWALRQPLTQQEKNQLITQLEMILTSAKEMISKSEVIEALQLERCKNEFVTLKQEFLEMVENPWYPGLKKPFTEVEYQTVLQEINKSLELFLKALKENKSKKEYRDKNLEDFLKEFSFAKIEPEIKEIKFVIDVISNAFRNAIDKLIPKPKELEEIMAYLKEEQWKKAKLNFEKFKERLKLMAEKQKEIIVKFISGSDESIANYLDLRLLLDSALILLNLEPFAANK